jgi:indole-3-glycerol phosphate synthase
MENAMPSFLKHILENKQREIESLKRVPLPFKQALKEKKISIIAEIKRSSPSKGTLGSINDPMQLAEQYIIGGASALSILTEELYFHGNLADLRKVALHSPVPILRKDFIIDPIQLKEALIAGASAVLLIVSLLKEKTALFLKEVKTLGMEALVEVHTYDEVMMALDAGAEIIGVNNRNLSNFIVDLKVAEDLAHFLPSHVVKVAESGIHTREDAKRMQDAGYDALLIGEALVKSKDPVGLIQEMRK